MHKAYLAVRRALVDNLEDMQALQMPTQSNSGLPEYRRAKAQQLQAQALEKNIASARELSLSQNLSRRQKKPAGN